MRSELLLSEPWKTSPIKLLSELVAIESCDPPGQEIEVARRIEKELIAAGIPVEVDEFAPGRANLLARLHGSGSKAPLVFSAHLDTVPVGTTGWTVDPLGGLIKDDRLYGRGASDMKSAAVAMTAALLEIATQKTPLAGDLVLAFSAGESSNCLGAKRFVEYQKFSDAGAILVGEPSSLNLIVAEMGVLWLRVTAWGRGGHISGDPGVNAIEIMAAFIAQLHTVSLPCPDHSLLPVPTLSVGTIRGGTAVNVTPDQCAVELDLRLRPGTTPEQVFSLFEAPGITVEVVDFKPSVETAPDHPFTKVCIDATLFETARNPTVGGVAYYSDPTIYAAAYGSPFVILGPGELGMSGQPDEYVEVENVHRAVRIYQRIAEAWLSK